MCNECYRKHKYLLEGVNFKYCCGLLICFIALAVVCAFKFGAELC